MRPQVQPLRRHLDSQRLVRRWPGRRHALLLRRPAQVHGVRHLRRARAAAAAAHRRMSSRAAPASTARAARLARLTMTPVHKRLAKLKLGKRFIPPLARWSISDTTAAHMRSCQLFSPVAKSARRCPEPGCKATRRLQSPAMRPSGAGRARERVSASCNVRRVRERRACCASRGLRGRRRLRWPLCAARQRSTEAAHERLAALRLRPRGAPQPGALVGPLVQVHRGAAGLRDGVK